MTDARDKFRKSLGLVPAEVESPVRVAVRRYKAARPKGLASGFQGMLATSPRAELRQDLRGLVAHSRYAGANIDFVKSYLMMVRRHVVGPRGIVLHMDVRNPDGTEDKGASAAIKAAWAEWGKRGNPTVCGRLSWWQVEKTAATMIAREGTFMARLWRGQEFGPHGFQIQPLSIDLLDVDMVMGLRDGAYVDGGVEFNRFGRPLAFHFYDGHPAEAHTGRGIKRIRIPADHIIHAFRQEETGQAHGVPAAHTALRRLNMLAKYEEAGLSAAHWGAANMVFLEREDGVAPAGDAAEEEATPEEMEAGAIIDLAPGVKARSNPSTYPDAAIAPFLRVLLQGGAAGLGVSYAGLTSDMTGANFSSLKDGRGEERDEWRMFQRDLYETLHQAVFDEWLPMAILSRRLTLPIAKLDKFRAASWRPRGWAAANAKDDVSKNDSDVALGIRSLGDIASERGDDLDEVIARRRAEVDKFRKADLPVPDALLGRKPGQGGGEAPKPQREETDD